MVLLPTTGAPCAAAGGRQEPGAEQEKLRRAEQLADRFVKRFGETLDFGVVYREMFVRDKAQRRRNAESVLNGLAEKRLISELDDATLEETFVAFMDSMYVSWLYMLNVKGFADKDPERYFPREVLREIRRTAFSECSLLLAGGADCDKLGAESFKTKGELARHVSHWRRLTALFRKHMPRRPFNNSAYKLNVRDIVWSSRQPTVNDGNWYFGIEKRIPVYEISRGMFLFNIIEERGVFRVLHLTWSQ